MEVIKQPDLQVFASSAKSGEVLKFPDILRGWGVTLDQTQGKPPLEWMNDAFKRIDLNILYQLQQGIPTWNKSVRYPKDAVVKNDGKIYMCLVENENNDPNLSSDKWSLLIKKATTAQAGITQLTSALSDREDLAATPKMVNDVNRAAKAAQTAANQANDKANTANTAAATADKKAVAAQNTANSANAAAKKAQTTADTAFKLLGDLKTINLDTLNSDDKCGVYYQTANANATPERNYPVKLAGTLEVFIAAGMTQRYTVYSTHDVYIRNNYGGKWDAWTKIPNTSDLIKVSDAFGDSRTLAGSQRTINEANRAAKAAQTAANQANDKANTANTAADNAQKKANQVPNPLLDQLPIGASGTAYKLITLADLKAKLGVPAAQKLYSRTGQATDGAMTQKAASDELSKKGGKNTAYKTENGWHKCAETGLIYQWGVFSDISAKFPIPFPAKALFISLSPNQNRNIAMFDSELSIKTNDNIGFTVYQNPYGRKFFAIGY